MSANPLSNLFDAIWEMFDKDAHFCNIVKPANRIYYNKDFDRNPIKENVTTEDMPEFAITFTGADVALFNTSSTSKLITRYSLIINTGDFRINAFLNDLNWVVICNLVQWKTKLAALKWRDANYVKRFDITSVAAGESIAERNRGIKGWTTVFSCEAELHLKTSDLVFHE